MSARNRKSVGLYHTNLSKANKVLTHHEFSRPDSDVKCLITTIAFGLVCHCEIIHKVLLHKGMDVPDVDIVVVYDLPSTLTQLYQVHD